MSYKIKISDQIEDAKLLALAIQRMANFDPAKLISQEEMDQIYGFSREDYENVDDIEFE